MKSIRTRLTRQILVGAFALLLVAGSSIGAVFHRRLVTEFDRGLEAKAGALESLTSREERKLDLEYSGDAMPEFVDGDEAEYYEVFLPDGTVVKKSPTLGEHHLPRAARPAGDAIFQNVRLRDGRRGRLVQIVFEPEVDEPDPAQVRQKADEDIVELAETVDLKALRVVLVIARGREHLDALLASMYLTLASMSGLLLAGLWFVVRRAISRGFEPINAMNAQLAHIGPETLENRVGIESPPEELATILAALNQLLGRVQSGFARERRFSSDVAHELRTPVAEIRTACEVGARWPDDPQAVRGFFEDIRDTALQMERIVANMLLLTRADNGTAVVERERVGVGRLVQECWDRMNGKIAAKQLRFENRIDPALVVETDPAELEMILQNLADNAVAHSVSATVIEWASVPTESGVDLVLSNRAAGLRPEDLAHVFERFWRKDSARTGQNHSGLGLSIVKSLADLLGLRVRVDLQDGGVFVVRLSFPAGIVR